MKAQIEVEMGEQTCFGCLLYAGESNGYSAECRLFGEIILRGERCPACLAKYGTGDQPDLRARMEADPTGALIADTCLSFRHDYGLMGPVERKSLEWEAAEWLRAWRKTLMAGGTFCVICQAYKIDGPDPRDAVVDAANEARSVLRAIQENLAHPVSARRSLEKLVAALDAEGGRG